MKVRFCLVAPLLACAAISGWAAAQSISQQVSNRPKVRAQLAAIPQLDDRLVRLEAALQMAQDRTSLTATTAQYLLEFMKAAKARPQLFDISIGQPQPQLPPPTRPPTRITDLMSSYGTFAELGKELDRAEALAAEIGASRDPMAGARSALTARRMGRSRTCWT